MSRDSPMSVHVNFRAAVWLVCFLRYDAPWHIHPHARQFLPRACKRSCWRAGVCLTAAFKKQKNCGNFPRKCSCLAFKKRTDAWGGAGTKRWLHQTRGHLTTRRQMPIGRGMCPHHTSCSNSSACTPFLLLTYRSTIC